MPRWMLGVAFIAGLLPGGILYWMSRPAVPAVLPPVSIDRKTVAVPSPPPPSTESDVKEKPREGTARRAPTAVFDVAELGRMLAERSHQLEAAQGAQADLTRQLRELEAKMDALVQEEAKRKTAEAELREQLVLAQKEAEAAKNAAQSREATLRETEAANQQLRKQVSEINQRSVRRRQTGTELEELGRRRESYLNNILGRYREATDLFRTMSLRIDNPRDTGSPFSNDLSRIQQAIQLADEDLRQLRVLNAQAARLQKELN